MLTCLTAAEIGSKPLAVIIFFASVKFFLTAIKTLSGFETTNWTSRRVGSGAVALCDVTKSSFAEMFKQENKVRDGPFLPHFSHIFSASSVTGWRTRIALNNIAEADFAQCRTFKICPIGTSWRPRLNPSVQTIAFRALITSPGKTTLETTARATWSNRDRNRVGNSKVEKKTKKCSLL